MFQGDPSLVSGKIDIDAVGRGEVGSGSWEMQGRLASPQLIVLQQNLGLLEHRFVFDQNRIEIQPIGSVPEEMLLRRVTVDHQLTDERLTVTQLSAELFGGVVHGDAVLVRNSDQSHQLRLKWKDIRPRFAVDLLPTRLPVETTTSGDLDWRVPANAVDQPAAHRGEAKILSLIHI